MNLLALTCRAVAEHQSQDAPLTQRALAAKLQVSLGKANQLVNQAVAAGFIEPAALKLTDAGRAHLDQFRVDNAILLAAGFGSRAVPLTYETPKGLLAVHGEPMVEREIRQLQAAGIKDIVLVVGYLKEQFEHLIDKFGVELVYNPEFATKNNLASLYHVRDRLRNSYILVADNWIRDNPFHQWEPDSWLAGLYFDGPTAEWAVTLGARNLVKSIRIGGADTWALLGPAHFTAEFSAEYVPLLEQAYATLGTEDWYWEHVIKENLSRLPFHLLPQDQDQIHELENLAELRAFDPTYLDQTNNAIMAEISEALGVAEAQVSGIELLKNGLTNSSFRFDAAGSSHVYRVPQPGANAWIDRESEAEVYHALEPLGATDRVIWLDTATGHRISEFLTGARPLDVRDEDELADGIGAVRSVHQAGLEVSRRLDPVASLKRLRELSDSKQAIQFQDYETVEARTLRAAEGLSGAADATPAVLTHGDFTASNVLVGPAGQITLIDWELAGMGDPLVDVASFALAARLAPGQATAILELYLERPPTDAEKRRLFAWAAATALANTLWAEYRQASGEQLGEYPLFMYRFAKDYSRLALGS
jgi:CTP:phosphocholine cytidylyltransferase-like protein/thiamine kinase-like enzyme